MIDTPKDKVSYAIICEKFPIPHTYFSTYEEAVRWIKLEQPDNRPHYIVKCTEHFEICHGVSRMDEEKLTEQEKAELTQKEIRKEKEEAVIF